jgi:hypothetical protein
MTDDILHRPVAHLVLRHLACRLLVRETGRRKFTGCANDR